MREYDAEHRNYVNFLENHRENDEEHKCKKDLEGLRYRGQRGRGEADSTFDMVCGP